MRKEYLPQNCTLGKVENNDFPPSFNLSFTPPLLSPLLPPCKTHSKLSNNVLSFTWLVLDYLPGSPCRPIKYPWSHHCLARSAFIMVINIQPPKVNGGTIKFRELWKFLLPRGLVLIGGNFTSHLPEVSLLNIRELVRRNCNVVPLHFTHRKAVIFFLSLCNPSRVTHFALTIVRDNMFLKALLFNWPNDRIFYSSPLTSSQWDNHIISFFRKTCSSVLPLISPLG